MAFRFAGHSRDTAQRGDPIRSRATFIDSVSVDPIISIPYPASLSLHANLPIARLHNNDSLYSSSRRSTGRTCTRRKPRSRSGCRRSGPETSRACVVYEGTLSHANHVVGVILSATRMTTEWHLLGNCCTAVNFKLIAPLIDDHPVNRAVRSPSDGEVEMRYALCCPTVSLLKFT